MDLGSGSLSRRNFRVRGRVLAPHIPTFLLVAFAVLRWLGVPGNKLVALGDPLLPTSIYTIYILIWG
jgi:hypothetical protein